METRTEIVTDERELNAESILEWQQANNERVNELAMISKLIY